MSLLAIQGVRKAFGAAQVLDDVSLDLALGEVHALVGANGAGKSTLIKILAGAYTRDAGEILIDGQPAALASPRDAIRAGVGVIYQEFNLVPELTVAENLLLGEEPRLRRLPTLVDRAGILREATAHLERLGFRLDAAAPVRRLRTGEKQLLEIAKALHRQARILVLDEPTAALSRAETEVLFGLMEGLRGRGIGMIYISHHLAEVFRVADRITVLRDGRNAGTWRRGTVTREALVRAMLGRDAAEPALREESELAASGGPLLRVDGLTGGGFAGVDLVLSPGEILALTGAAGSGYSDLTRALGGAVAWREGRVLLDGRPARWGNPAEASRAGIVYAPGDRKSAGLLRGLGLAENLAFPFYGSLSRAGVLRPSAVKAHAERLITGYGIRAEGPGQRVDTLSGGNQQKVVVARTAERRGKVYLFDEPTRGVDIGSREDLYRFIYELARQGAGVLVATPDIEEALRLGHRLAVFRQGKIVLTGRNLQEEAVLGAIVGGTDG